MEEEMSGLRVLIFVLIAGTLGACAATSGGTFCDNARPQRFTDATVAAMSDAELNDALAHNLKGQRLCGWTP